MRLHNPLSLSSIIVKNIRWRCMAAFVLLTSSSLFAQQGVHVSNEDPRWGEKITVNYITEDTSSFAKPDSRDTLFCAVIVHGSRPEHGMVLPMRHVSGANYEAELTVPDSTHSLWVDICVPTDRVPNGVTQFTCRTRDGRTTVGSNIEASSTNIDSALDADLKEYPKYYTLYVAAYDHANQVAQSGERVMPDSAWKPWTASLIDRLKATPDNTASWHLALGELYLRQRKDSLANIEFQFAAQTQGFDPLFNDADFWNSFFAPSMKKGGGLTFPVIPGRIIAPLVEQNPRSMMARTWLRHMAWDTLLPANVFRNVSKSYAGSEAETGSPEGASESHDVDLLTSISYAYGYPKGPLYNPKEALVWCDRAEESVNSLSSFYSGDNIWGGMGRLKQIIAQKVTLLAKLGRLDEAETIGRSAMASSKAVSDKQQIGGALANAYFEAGRIEDAKRTYGEVIELGTGGYISGLNEFYEKFKEGSETQQEFSARLAKEYGGTLELPSIPDFAYTTLDGMSGTLAGLRGKVVVLDCWFTSCAGCIIEKSSLNKLVDSFHGDTNVVFLSIATNDEKSLRYYLEHTESKFKIVPDGSDICEKIGVTGYPTHIIIGKDGKTLGFEMGGNEHQDEQMRPKIEQALGKM
jgi:peroxiredoxin